MEKLGSIVMLLSNAFRPDPRVKKEAEGLAAAGYQLTILCWDRLAELPPYEKLGPLIDIIRIRNVRSSYGVGLHQVLPLARFWFSALKMLDHLKPDLVHCHDFDTLPAGLFWGKLHHIPVIYDAHEYYADLVKPRLHGLLGTIIYKSIKISEKKASSMASAVVTVDNTLAGIYRLSNSQVLVLGHYPQKSMADKPNPVFTRPVLRLLYAGRISEDRGAILYIDLLRCLLDHNIPTKLIFAGIFTPESEELNFEKHVAGLGNYIDQLGWIPFQNIADVYRSADVGLSILMPVPRYVAALPVKLFEYMAGGLPVIASNFPSISSIVTETSCGILVNPKSRPEDIALIIQDWWKTPSHPQLMGENGRKAIQSKFNWEAQIGRLSLLYHQLISDEE